MPHLTLHQKYGLRRLGRRNHRAPGGGDDPSRSERQHVLSTMSRYARWAPPWDVAVSVGPPAPS